MTFTCFIEAISEFFFLRSTDVSVKLVEVFANDDSLSKFFVHVLVSIVESRMLCLSIPGSQFHGVAYIYLSV